MVQIVNEPIDPQQSYRQLHRHNAGSVLLHYAVVKADGGTGRVSSAVNYQAAQDTQDELETIASALKARWPLEGVLLQRRSGRLAVGEIISLVAVAAEASADSFAACQMGLDLLKRMQTIRKQEVFV
jgi:molybdopterin synthase catalytic subunit